MLDEPTTGLHFLDIQNMLKILHRIKKAGNTVIVIEHNLEVIKNADWIIDMGPLGGNEGGLIIMENLNLLSFIEQYAKKPALFEPGEAKFWDDPYISKSMLKAHLNPNNDVASRRHVTIDKTVRNLIDSKIIIPGMKILDLGCGPGLYAERLCREGVVVVGIDKSKRSIEYAEKSAADKGLKIEYRCSDFFDMDYIEEFDAVIQIYGEINTFSDKSRDKLFGLVHLSLKKDGLFIFDVSTRQLRSKYGILNRWYISEGGFWRPSKHIVMEQGFDYPNEEVWLDQYIVIDEYGAKTYRNWFHDYSVESIEPTLFNAGYKTKHVWNDLTGSKFTDDGDWIAICSEKRIL